MRRLSISLGLAAALFASPIQAADTFKIDSTHTSFAVLINHLGYSTTPCKFNQFEGEFTFSEANLAANAIKLTIRTASIDTNDKPRDHHLRSPDFFNVAEFPTMTFVSTRVDKTGDKTGKVTGNLTLLGVTKPITLDVTFNKLAPHPLPRYNKVLPAGFSARGTLKRSEWDMKFGVPNLGDDVQRIIEVEGAKS